MAEAERSERGENELERTVMAARAGQIGEKDFMRALIGSDIFVPSSTAVEPDGTGLRPLLYGAPQAAGEAGEAVRETHVAVFTSADRAEQTARQTGLTFLLQINVLALLRRVPPDLGMALNPGSEASLRIEISAAGYSASFKMPTQAFFEILPTVTIDPATKKRRHPFGFVAASASSVCRRASRSSRLIVVSARLPRFLESGELPIQRALSRAEGSAQGKSRISSRARITFVILGR